MARYDYRCPKCGTTFEVEHPMSERPQVMCPECGSEASQVFGTSGILFKGSGFYNTDQRKGGATTATSSETSKKETKYSSETSSKD